MDKSLEPNNYMTHSIASVYDPFRCIECGASVSDHWRGAIYDMKICQKCYADVKIYCKHEHKIKEWNKIEILGKHNDSERN